MKHIYYVSYSHKRGFGCSAVPMTRPITTYEHVMQVAHAIEDNSKTLDRGDVVVLNYILLRTEGES